MMLQAAEAKIEAFIKDVHLVGDLTANGDVTFDCRLGFKSKVQRILYFVTAKNTLISIFQVTGSARFFLRFFADCCHDKRGVFLGGRVNSRWTDMGSRAQPEAARGF
jgi:hypothetical protein